MINRVILIGRLTADPELRYTTNGTAVTSFRIAVNRRFKNQQGETEADFLNIVCWQKLAELVAQYMSKGRQVAVDGRLQSRTYEAQDGQRRYVVEVVADNVQFLDSKGSSNDSAATRNDSDKELDFSDEDSDLPF